MDERSARLAAAFARYRRPATMDGCPCCTDDAVARRLLDGPLPEVLDRDLAHYAFKALTTWGAVRDYKYFLPEILGRAAARRDETLLRMTCSKLTYGGFAAWPEGERGAVRAFLAGALRDAVRDGHEWFADTLTEAAAEVPGLDPLGGATR